MEFVRGRIFRDITLANVHPDQRTAIYDAMNEALATLHGSSCFLSLPLKVIHAAGLNVQKLGLGDFGKPGNYYARQLDRWVQQYEASKTGGNARDGRAHRVAQGACARR
jgi:aminoglycoside phosphotransferase (APT) family kinase protein